MTTTNLSEIEIELLRKNKQLIGDYARLSYQNQALQDRISSLTLALQAAHKGIARIKKKADYHRTAANDIITLIQKSDYAHTLFKQLPASYDGPKPEYERGKSLDEYREMERQRDHFRNRAMKLAVEMSFMRNAKPVESESESEDNGIQVSDTASGKGTIRFDFGRD